MDDAFEKWWAENIHGRYANGEYEKDTAAYAWRSATERAAKVCRDLKDGRSRLGHMHAMGWRHACEAMEKAITRS